MSITIQTSYSGEVLEHILTLLATENELVKRRLIHIEPNVSKDFSIPRMVLQKMLQKRKEQPTSADSKGGITIDEVKLTPEEAMVYFEFNPRRFEKFWRPWQPKGNLVFAELPDNVKGQFVEAVLAQAQEEIGYHLINGVSGDGDDNFFTGFLTRIISNNDVIRVDNSDSSMIKRLRAVRKAIPKEIRRKSNLRILMSQNDFDLYDQELTDLHHKGEDETAVNKEVFKGIRIEVLSQWPDDVIVATLCGDGLDTNLWAACNLVDDTETLLIDKVSAAGEMYFFKLLFKMDTNIAWGGMTVLLDRRGKPSVEEIHATPEIITLPAEGGEAVAIVVATGAYTLAGTHTGFEIKKVEGGIHISAEANSTGSDRTGTVELQLTGTSKTAKVELFQGNGE